MRARSARTRGARRLGRARARRGRLRNKFSLPTETPGGVIPEKGSYAYTGSVRGLTRVTDVLLTRGTGSTLYVVYDFGERHAPTRGSSARDGSTPPLSYTFAGLFKPIRICQAAGPAVRARRRRHHAREGRHHEGSGLPDLPGSPAAPRRSCTRIRRSRPSRGIAADPAGNVYVSGVGKEFIRDDPQDSRRRTYKYVSRVYRYLAAQGFIRDTGFYVDDGQGVGTVSEPPATATSIRCSGDGYLYVADTGKDVAQRMQIQVNNGSPLPAIAFDGGQTGTTFIAPTDCVADASGFIYIVDTGNHRVLRYDGGGLYIQRVDIELDLDADSLHVPVATSCDDSLVYVADYATGKVASYKRRK